MKLDQFNVKMFQSALENVRVSQGLTWKQVAEKSGVSASTLTRISQGKRPDVDSLSALIRWSTLDSRRFVGQPDESADGRDSLAEIGFHLRADKSLTPEAVDIMEAMIKAAYQQIRKEDVDGD